MGRKGKESSKMFYTIMILNCETGFEQMSLISNVCMNLY